MGGLQSAAVHYPPYSISCRIYVGFEETFTSGRGPEYVFCKYGVTRSLSLESPLESKYFFDTDESIRIVQGKRKMSTVAASPDDFVTCSGIMLIANKCVARARCMGIEKIGVVIILISNAHCVFCSPALFVSPRLPPTYLVDIRAKEADALSLHPVHHSLVLSRSPFTHFGGSPSHMVSSRSLLLHHQNVSYRDEKCLTGLAPSIELRSGTAAYV